VQALTASGSRSVQNLAQRYGVSVDAVTTLLFAVSAGGGSMAQFYHPELGGGGQWMRGGMTMVGDMFNHGLQSTVAGLCSELSALLGSEQVFQPAPAGVGGRLGGLGNAWWPSELGNPSSSGGQNDSRYAVFPQTRRLAIERNGQLAIHDTLDHQIGGVQQQQGGSHGSLSFTSQFGTFTVDSLPLVSPITNQPAQTPSHHGQPPAWQASPEPRPFVAQTPQQPQMHQHQQPGGSAGAPSHAEILATIERLNDLFQRGIVSEDEFRSKKAELLSRL
jgi:hypothetical protein